MNGTVLRAVRASGHRYDTSVFPCAPYYLAKAGIMGLMRLRGKISKSVLGHPACLLAPRHPYAASLNEPYRVAKGMGFREFPISVLGGIPLIGTAFTALGSLASLGVVKAAARTHSHLTLEFHAADLLSIDEDGLPKTLAVQPDLRISWKKKYTNFASLLKRLGTSAQFERLDVIAGGAS